MAEGARLESVYTATYRGFESLPHRHIQRKSLYASTGFFVLYRDDPGGMRSLDTGSTTGAARGTVCEPCELTARRVRPSGPNQSLPHRHIQRKSLYASTVFLLLYRARKTAGALRLPALQYLPEMFCRVGKRKRTHLPRARNLS